jgi:hypothetical protein
MRFYPYRLIKCIVLAHFIIYLPWAFIVLSLTEPFIETFSSENGRALYLTIILGIVGSSAPYFFPFLNNVNDASGEIPRK